MKERTPGKHTLLGTLIAIMAVVGSVSVGFSAWTFGITPPAQMGI